ncbi:MAG: glycoside hydrolase family 99-like domain-containing protein [Clostridia bacterium]|nr:glycoside hydrolase family 99-like domain-containing protein [Clostridia bacterium]
MQKILEKIKYTIANDIGYHQSMLIASDACGDPFDFSVRGIKNLKVVSFQRASISAFRKSLKSVDDVVFEKINDANELENQYFHTVLLSAEDAPRFLPTKGFSSIGDTIILPILTAENKQFAEQQAEKFRYVYWFGYFPKGDYHYFELTTPDHLDPVGLVVLSNTDLKIRNGYSVLNSTVDHTEEKLVEELFADVTAKRDAVNGLYVELERCQGNLYLLTGPFRVIKRIILRSAPVKLLRKCRKAYREGGMSLVFQRIRSFLGLSKMNAEADEYFQIFDPGKEYVDYDASYQDNQDFSGKQTDVKMLAYYLPQYHTFKENDEWWGKGFTEWSNTRVAEPRFNGHYQPRVPHEDIGYYDLSDIETMRKQAALAKQHGIYGFCFYYYWFSGKRLMEKPVDMLLEHPEIDIPFCLCWANENWTRAWDGQNRDILIQQDYSESDDDRFIRDLKPYIDDKRYIKVKGKPLVIVYNPGQIPDCKRSFNKWREVAREIGIGEILIWTCRTANNTAKRLEIEDYIDAEIEFPPHNTWLNAFAERNIDLKGKSASIFNYQKMVDGIEYDYFTGKDKKVGKKPVHHACMMAWDNAARRKNNWFTYHHFSLKSLYRWVLLICTQARRDFDEDERFVFVNAWNEWAEGTYLEPDQKYGYANINTVSKALMGLPFDDDVAVINEPGEPNCHFHKKIAVQVHMFYTETLAETIENLNKIPYPFDCFFSTDTEEKATLIRQTLKEKCNCEHFTVELFDSRGRDVAPFLVQMADRIDDYDYICHIHSKRTVTGDHGNEWRKYIFRHLFGSKEYLCQKTAEYGNGAGAVSLKVVGSCSLETC